MEYNDIIARKREMEEAICKAIRRFETDTRLSVYEVGLSRAPRHDNMNFLSDLAYAKTTVYLEAP